MILIGQAALTEYNPLSPNMLLYWAAIQYNCLAGTSVFDFGRSTRDSTQHEFKRRWGAQTVPLCYEYGTQRGHRLELTTRDSPRYRKKVEVWKRMPLWATRLVGPMVSRALA